MKTKEKLIECVLEVFPKSVLDGDKVIASTEVIDLSNTKADDLLVTYCKTVEETGVNDFPSYIIGLDKNMVLSLLINTSSIDLYKIKTTRDRRLKESIAKVLLEHINKGSSTIVLNNIKCKYKCSEEFKHFINYYLNGRKFKNKYTNVFKFIKAV